MIFLKKEEIITLIQRAKTARSELNNLELKDARGGFPDNVWRTISSFSHRPEGGVIVFGVAESKDRSINVVGLGDRVADIQERIPSFIQEKMSNCGEYNIELFEVDGKFLVSIEIKELRDEFKPAYYIKLSLPRGACIRNGIRDETISEDQMREFIKNSRPFKHDQEAAKDIVKADLSDEKIEDFFDQSAERIGREKTQVTLEDLKNTGILLNKDQPTNAGFLLFSKFEPQRKLSFSRYTIQCAKFAGHTVSSDILDKEDVKGTLDEQIDKVYSFILKNIRSMAEVQGVKRIERYEYPEKALRELVANAVIHRDYQLTETYTKVNIFSNRIEIINPGNLPPGIRIEDIKNAQFSRNEIIARIMNAMNYLEEFGRGINIVYEEMKKWDLPEPYFENSTNSFKAVLLNSEFNKLNERQISIWRFIQSSKRISPGELKKSFDFVSAPTINNDLKKLIELNLIQRNGSGPLTQYEIVS